MQFNNKKDQKLYFRSLYYLNSGSQGECYLDKNKKVVYKLLFYYDGLTKEELFQFSGIKNKTFREASLLAFLKEFRKSLSEYAGKDIERLSKVK